MRWRFLSGVGVVVLTLGLLPAVAAGAQGGGGLFHVQASNGYEVVVLAGGDEHGTGAVTLFAADRHSLASYKVPATVTATSIQADLGALGRIDVELVPSGEGKVEKHRCGKRKIAVEPATYQGTIEFHGEGGYTEVSASSAPFDYASLLRTVCGAAVNSGEVRGPGIPGAALFAQRRDGDERLSFSLRKNHRRARTRIEARVSERHGEIRIQRAIQLHAGAGAFAYDPKLRRAVLMPPAPFAGHASFNRGAERGHRWHGNLTIDFPGREDVPATGAGFGVKLVHSEWLGSAH